MSGGNTTSRSSSGVSGQLGENLFSAATGLTSLNPIERAMAMQQMFYNPQQYGQIGELLGQTATGGKLDVMSDPAVQNWIKSITTTSQRNLGQSLADLRSRAALAGHGSTGLSGPLQRLQMEGITRNQESLNSALAGPLMELMNTERGRQLQALSGWLGYQTLPSQMAMQIAPMFATGKNTQAYNPSALQQAMGGLMGLVSLFKK